MLRATSFLRAGRFDRTAFDTVTLAHHERQLRRKLIVTSGGEEIMVDLAETVTLGHGDVLVLEDGRAAGIVAATEELYAVSGQDERHVRELCWHLGNRHLPCQIEETTDGAGRLLILRDHVIRDMLEHLGAAVGEVDAPFVPVRGAYHGARQSHGHTHDGAHRPADD